MKKFSILLPVAALLVCAGCAQTRSTAMGASPSTSATGASTASSSSGPRLICRDGYWTSAGGSCADHGGTVRALSSQ